MAGDEVGRWVEHGRRPIYDSEWVRLETVDVETPSGQRFDHHVVRAPLPAVAALVLVDESVLMIRRHRFITDSWGWELPAGRLDPGEHVLTAAHRECVEETGWKPGALTEGISWHPSNGLLDQTFTVTWATSAQHQGEPTDPDEAIEVAWQPLGSIGAMIADARICDGLSMTSLCWWLAGHPGPD